MILILSIDGDYSTNQVTDWLDRLKADYIRIHPEELLNNISYINIGAVDTIHTNNRVIKIDKVNVVWYRKWHKKTPVIDVFEETENENLTNVLQDEQKFLTDFIFNAFSNALWINKPSIDKFNKLDQMRVAKEVGFNIPKSIITNSKETLNQFIKKEKNIITKSFNSVFDVDFEGKTYSSYTTRINNSDFNFLPKHFSPSLFQAEVSKYFEIRAFVWFKKIYSMAIFSQDDKQTSVDFRRYNTKKPNRVSHIKLPSEIELKIFNFMDKVNLVTGSFDFIYSSNKEYFFLEVNPFGQFGMVSEPLNYDAHEHVAKSLNDYDNGKDIY